MTVKEAETLFYKVFPKGKEQNNSTDILKTTSHNIKAMNIMIKKLYNKYCVVIAQTSNLNEHYTVYTLISRGTMPSESMCKLKELKVLNKKKGAKRKIYAVIEYKCLNPDCKDARKEDLYIMRALSGFVARLNSVDTGHKIKASVKRGKT